MSFLADVEFSLALVAGLLWVILMLLFAFIGAFHTITFHKSNMPPRIFVYKTHRGPLKEVGPRFQAVIHFMENYGFDDSKLPTAGIYYEDPGKVSAPRYAVGFLIDEDDTKSKEKWEHLAKDTKGKWSVLHLKSTPTIVSFFPMRWTAVSCVVSAMKTYSAFRKSGHELECGSVEIYRADTKTIETHFPQGNQEQFNPQVLDSFPPANSEKKVQ